MQRILVIDDDPAVTTLLKRGLSYAGYIVDVAASGDMGLLIAREHPPELVVLDIMMPGLDGLEVLRRLRVADEQLPVLLLTGKDSADDEIRGLGAGADDYVRKPFTFEVLLARVRTLLRQRQLSDRAPLLHFADITLDVNSHRVRYGASEVPLTSLEFKLLRTFLEHPGQVLSKELLLDRVWGYDFSGSTNVAEVYVKRLRQKLLVVGGRDLIQTVRGAGYILQDP